MSRAIRYVVSRPTPPPPPSRHSWPSVRWLALLAAVMLVVPAASVAGTAQLSATPGTVAPGATVKVRGSGFAKGEVGYVVIDPETTGPMFRASGKGTFSVNLKVPRGAAQGRHGIEAVSTASVLLAATQVVVTSAGTDPSAAPTGAPGSPAPPAPAPTQAPATPPPTIQPTAIPTVGPTTAPATPPPAPSPTATPRPTATPDAAGAFVAQCGLRLCLDGSPFQFVGLNIYNANSRDNCWYPLGYSNSALGDALTAVGPGQDVFRAWFYQDLATSNGSRDWSAFDHTLAVARAHGLRVIVTLADQWGSCDSGPGGAVYKTEGWYTNGYRTKVGSGTTTTYRDYVAEIVTRYQSDPTILAWQLMNEAEIKPSLADTCSTNASEILRTWAADVAGLVKSIDQNHLVSLGTLGGGQCGMAGTQYKYVHSIGAIDLCEYHDYLPEAMPGDEWTGLALRIQQCAELGKPIFVGESGQKDMSLAARAARFDAKFAAQFGAGVAGELVWALRTADQGGSSASSYDVGPNDPIIDLFGRY
jgi:mannan endo-1,4-beta-mannosidase